MSDLIVYSQTELDAALADGITAITLSAGAFKIPEAANTVFKRIGPVKVNVDCTAAAAERAGMIFEGIYPLFRSAYARENRASMAVVAVTGGSSGSFPTSGSYLWGSGSGSSIYFYEYEFRYGGSARTSLGGSYSFPYSFSGALSMSLSYSFAGAARSSAAVLASAGLETISVFGYGINLI